MGIYGKYTKPVTIFSIIQMVAGVLMIGLGIAHRVLVCSWITDIAFGFWVGLLVCSSTVVTNPTLSVYSLFHDRQLSASLLRAGSFLTKNYSSCSFMSSSSLILSAHD